MGHHDVFISYAREDRAKVEKIAHALTQRGLHVWWDPEIKTGAGFRQEIAEALSNTRSVLVIWSRYSVGSRFVCDEADEGAARDILFPALIDNVDIPLGFRQIQTADLTHWRGNQNDPALKAFIATVADGAANAHGAPDRAREPSVEDEPAPPAPVEEAQAPAPKPKPPKPKQQKTPKRAYTTTGSRRRLALFGQSVFMAALIAAAFAALAYTSDFVFAAYRPFFVGAMGVLAFLSRYGTLEADRAAGAASLALLPRSYIALILFSLIAISPLVLEGRLYAAALEGVQVKGIEGADINAVAFDANGERLLTSSDDNYVKLWDAKTGVELGEFSDHRTDCADADDNGKPLCWVWGADFSPDGRYAVSASRDLTARIWETPSGAFVTSLEGHRSSVYDAAWHPEENIIATASSDDTIIIWDSESGDALRTLTGHTANVNAIDFSPDGDLIASASDDGNVRLWNWRNGARVSALSIG
ncbi:MAG: toll/interleukin-1 receptor domain-containing protein, partial [Hyphococcus sp.]